MVSNIFLSHPKCCSAEFEKKNFNLKVVPHKGLTWQVPANFIELVWPQYTKIL